MSATLVLTNGRFHTMDPANPTTTAIAIRHHRILATGTNDAMKALLSKNGEWIDLNGRSVTPGLVDAHVHFQNFSLHLQRVQLHNTTSLQDALHRIQSQAAALGSQNTETWLQGRNWSQNDWADQAFPTAAALDSVCPDRPACLPDKSGHAAWVNSKALHHAGITAETPDPPGGKIQRDELGNPTGILFEEAIKLVSQHIPRPTAYELAQAMKPAQEACWQAGLTGLHDFDGRSCFIALQILHHNRELGLRFIKNIPVYRLEHAIGIGLRSGFGSNWLRIGGVKLFADGALGPRTAAMIEPYEGEPDNRGIVVTDKEEMHARVSEASAAGLSATIHAIGDRANHDVLDVYAAVRKAEKQRAKIKDSTATTPASTIPLRHRIEHVQILHPADLHRLAELNLIASMQPIHATSDISMAETYWGKRTPYAYAWRTMLNNGTTLVFGSDAPVEPIEPIRGIHAAVTRCRPDGSPGQAGWHPEQKLSLHETIHAFTMGAALTSGQETDQGSITPGKLADLTIFDRNIFKTPPANLLDVHIDGTIVNGRFRHRAF
ncbi:MAG: amidohydrolase [Chloroflexi bacterium]|nr:MAG: amidohydrolase [Chloroflexota bacterium]